MAYRILVIDDETEVVAMLQSFLTRNNYQVSCALEGAEAISKAKEQPDLILLDINMPQMDGIEVCKEIRDIVTCPILFLTARDQDSDKVEGFDAGGDDYIVKPFSLAELKARIEAHLRRERRDKEIQRKVFGEITIDYSVREVFVRGESIHFNRKEFDIIKLLSLNRGQVFDRGKIYDRVWGLEGDGDDTVGFSEKDLANAALAYYRGEKTETGAVTHFGLGLYICNLLAGKLDGNLYLGNGADGGGRVIFKCTPGTADQPVSQGSKGYHS